MTTQTADFSRMTSLLAAIAKQLDIITRHILPVAPNYRYPLKKYWQFNWDGIDAIVLKRDEEGPTLVKWGNYTWKRRSGGGKFGTAVCSHDLTAKMKTGIPVIVGLSPSKIGLTLNQWMGAPRQMGNRHPSSPVRFRP